MDDVMGGALAIVHDYQVWDPERFFDSVVDAYQELDIYEGGPTLDKFLELFFERAEANGFGDAADEFARYVEANGGIDLVRRLTDEGTGNLLARYERLLAGDETGDADESGGEDGDEEYDEQAWNAFLQRFGPEWNGEEDAWGPFRDYFLYYADEEGLRVPASAFVEYAEGEPDKIAFFAQYGIEVGAVDDDTDLDAWYAFLAESGVEWDGLESSWPRFRRAFLEAAAAQGLTSAASGFLDYAEGEPDRAAFLAQYGMIAAADTETGDVDPDAWGAFLEAFGPAWDGDEANWEAFRAYFLHHAAEWGVEPTATGFVDYAEGEPDKITFFAQYGIDVGAGADAGTADEVVEAARQRAQEVAVASPVVPPEHVGLVSDAFAELVGQVPEAAGLTAVQIRQLIEEVAAEHL